MQNVIFFPSRGEKSNKKYVLARPSLIYMIDKLHYLLCPGTVLSTGNILLHGILTITLRGLGLMVSVLKMTEMKPREVQD